MAHYFTVEEANQVVDKIRPWVKEILEIRQGILDRQPDVWPVVEKAAGNGGSQAASQITREFSHMEALVHKIQETGAMVKDINTGLLDFLSLREGQEVYLCWQFDEDEIKFWHSLDAGFAGRQPI
jgi:hypothetical protein